MRWLARATRHSRSSCSSLRMPDQDPASRVTVVIPAKDEEGLIVEIIDSVRPYADEILVVDGHSKDRTKELAIGCGARVIQDNGHGKGEAVRLAIHAAITGIVVFIDADGSRRSRRDSRIWSSARAGKAAATNCTARCRNSSATSGRRSSC